MNIFKRLLFSGLLVLITSLLSVTAMAQANAAASAEPASDNAWIFIAAVLITIGIGGVVAWRYSQKEAVEEKVIKKGKGFVYDWKPESFKADTDDGVSADSRTAAQKAAENNPSLHGIDIEEVKEKMEKIRFSRLPINQIKKIDSPRPFSALPVGDDDDLLKAIDNSDVEYVEAEEERESALETLAKYQTRNSVDALTQMALYDVSSTLRSKAVGALADFDHESVFETVILACADPTREVRAAGAKALFKLSFNRTNAWLRLADCGDDYRLSQAAKAVTEADFVGRTLDRLVHKDISYAREALSLLTLLIRADQLDELLDYLVNGENSEVKYAILQVFRIVDDKPSLEKLAEVADSGGLTDDFAQEIRELAETPAPVAA